MAKKTILTSSLNKIAQTLAAEIAAAETQRLKKNATEANWPADVVDGLAVSTMGKGHSVVYPEAVKDRVLDLEYGIPGMPPSPVIRSLLLGVK